MNTDLYYLIFGNDLPSGITHSQYVHQSTFSLIASIVFAIALILLFFRPFAYKDKKYKWLYKGGFIWICFNILLVFATAWKNVLYITMFDSFTLKRIGVYIFLALCLAGLVLTFFKMRNRQTIFYFIERCGGWFWLIFCFCTVINFSSLVTSYNINHNIIGEVDIHYLTYKVSDRNVIPLAKYYKNHPEYFSEAEKKEVEDKIYNVQKEAEKSIWSSSIWAKYAAYELDKLKINENND